MKNPFPLKSSNSLIRAKVLIPTLSDPVIWFLCYLYMVSTLRARIISFIPEFTELRTGPVIEEVLSEHSFIHSFTHSTSVCYTQMRAVGVLCVRAKALSHWDAVSEFLEHAE